MMSLYQWMIHGGKLILDEDDELMWVEKQTCLSLKEK
jgi:hypothetical protein